MPKKHNPKSAKFHPPQTSDKHPRVRDPADSSIRSYGTRETLAVPPAPPRLRDEGVSVSAVLAQPSRRRKGFLRVHFLLSLVMEGRRRHLEAPGEQGAIRGDHERSAPALSPAPGQPLAGERLELRQPPTARLCSWFSRTAKLGLALLFPDLSQGITLLSPFWEKGAFWSIGAFRRRAWPVLGRAPGCSCCRASGTNRRRRRPLRACTHTHVHSPENGEELIPEANLLCSNPAAVTGSPRVLGSGAATDHIAFMPAPGASLSHCLVAGGGAGTSEKGRHRSQRLFTSREGSTAATSKQREPADCRPAA